MVPTYEYACTACGHSFERRQAITAAPLSECPICSGPVRRLIGGGGAILVRSGGRESPSCALERTGTTCCGRSERCDTPGCG